MEEVKEIAGNVIESNIEINEYLRRQNNIFADKDVGYFKTNHLKRLKTFKKDKIDENQIFEYLQILASIEQDNSLEKLTEIKTVQQSYYRTNGSGITIKINSPMSVYQFKMNYYTYVASRLPYCCGVTEYGNFNFINYERTDSTLALNLMLDLIRLSADRNRKNFSGAVGLINYFIGTPFGDVLNNRDDINLVKEFRNPKTSATLRLFTFDTKI